MKNGINEEAFVGIMEGKGWSFCRTRIRRIDLKDLPKNFELSSFRNDVFRSVGGFARKFGVLKRARWRTDCSLSFSGDTASGCTDRTNTDS